MKDKSPLFLRSIALIKKIPEGKVATYSHVAQLVGAKGCARHVSFILNSSSSTYDLPWHRVLNSQGKISLKIGQGYFRQKSLLENEGIEFKSNKIDLDKYLWQPTDSQLQKILNGLPSHVPLAVR